MAPTIKVLAPTDGGLALEGAPLRISWKARGLEGDSITVEWRGGEAAEWEEVATIPAELGGEGVAWTPAGPPGAAWVRLRSAGGLAPAVERRVEVVPSVVEVVMGSTLAFCLRSDGTVRWWGWVPEEYYSSYGNEPPSSIVPPMPDPPVGIVSIRTPAVLPGLTHIRSLAPMGPNCKHLLAVTDDGRVIQWGSPFAGPFGSAALPPLLEPVEVAGLSDVEFCRAGGSISFARLRDGRVYGWGRNQAGTLGDGTDEMRIEPFLIPALEGVVDISVGWIHCLALRPDGTVVSWGQNARGTLGDGTWGLFYRTTPEPVPGVSNAVQILTGYDHSVALLEDGTVWTWGDGGWGQLGRDWDSAGGDGWFDPNPGRVLGLPKIVRIYGSGDEVYAVAETGETFAWGSNGLGQLGTGFVTTAYTGEFFPVLSTAIPPITRLFAGSGGAGHAITTDGTWIAWGGNIGSLVGDGSDVTQLHPVPIVVR